MTESKLKTFIENSLYKQVDREKDKKYRKVYAKIKCTQKDLDEFIDTIEGAAVWSARADFDKQYGTELLQCVYFMGRRFFFMPNDKVKRLSIQWF